MILFKTKAYIFDESDVSDNSYGVAFCRFDSTFVHYVLYKSVIVIRNIGLRQLNQVHWSLPCKVLSCFLYFYSNYAANGELTCFVQSSIT